MFTAVMILASGRREIKVDRHLDNSTRDSERERVTMAHLLTTSVESPFHRDAVI